MNLIAFTKSREKAQYFVPKRDGLNMVKSQPNTFLIWKKKVISELKRSDGKTVVNEQEIMTAIQTFYENLYSSDIDHHSNNVF